MPVKDEGSGPKSLIYRPPHLSKLISLANSWPLADPRLFQAHCWAFALAISLSSPESSQPTSLCSLSPFAQISLFNEIYLMESRGLCRVGIRVRQVRHLLQKQNSPGAGGREQKQLSHQDKYILI